MFGASLWSGGDVNAAAMGADPGGETQNSSGYWANSMDTAGETSNPGDPAMAATNDSYKNAAGINQQTSSAMGIAGSIGKNQGLFSALDMFSPRARHLAKRQRVYARHQAQFAVNQAQRAIDQYKQDSAIQEQKLAQSYSGRGLGESSIQQEGMQYFKDTAARQAAQLDENLTLAQMGQRLVHSQISESYAQSWLSIGNAAASLL